MVLYPKRMNTMKNEEIPINTPGLLDESPQILGDTSSDLIKAIEILQSPKNLEGNTILTNQQVNALTLMNWAGQVYNIEFFKHFTALFPRYRISGDDGRGRKEIIQIAEAIRREKYEQHQRNLEMLTGVK
jgi:hypothetical protein